MNIRERLNKVMLDYDNNMGDVTPSSKDIGNGFSVSRTDTPSLHQCRRELRGNYYLDLVQILRDAVRLNDSLITIRCAELIEEVLKEIKNDDLSLYLNESEMINHKAMRLMDVEFSEMFYALDSELAMFSWTAEFEGSKDIDIIIYYSYLGYKRADMLRNFYDAFSKNRSNYGANTPLTDEWIKKSREFYQQDPELKFLLEDILARLRGDNTSLDLIGNLDSDFYIALRKILD